MPEIQHQQPLTNWPGDTASLIAEMKRRAGVRTDQGLARFLGVAQSTVAHWRARSKIPEAAILKFEAELESGAAPSAARALAARMIVLRIPEYWYSAASAAGAQGGRDIFYESVAAGFHSILDEAYSQLAKLEEELGQHPIQIASRLLEDDRFLQHMLASARGLSVEEAVAREKLSPVRVRTPRRKA